ncbi:MAG: ABC transporter ATP-binding protein [Chloroflexi bacterium]|nr:MAG: ABC transporter ATP-binding protein [Chloroflexota bacterium]
MINTKERPTISYWQLLKTYMQPQKKAVALLTGLIISSITLQLINPQLVRRFLDAVETGRTLRELFITSAIFIGIALLAQVIKVAATYIGENVAWTATNHLRADLALHCLKLDMSFHKTHKPGELIERVDGDVNKLANFFSQLIIQLLSNFLLIIGVIVLLWLVDWRVGLTITLIAGVGLFVLNWIKTYTVPRWERLRQISSDLFGYLEEWLNGTEEIQTNRAAPYVMNRLYRLLRDRWQAKQHAMRLNLVIMSLPIVVPTLAYIAAYIWGDQLFRNGVLTIGTVYLIFYYIDVLKSPLWTIQRYIQDLQQAAASLNRISALFAEQPTIWDGPVATMPSGSLAVQFEDVSFHYEDDETAVLSNINFHLQPGRILGLLGRTGSGKTTITRLLYRFYDPTSGTILLGNSQDNMAALPQLQQQTVRQHIGMVTQDVQLFHASVRDNLTLFNEHISDERILSSLIELGLQNWLNELDNGLDTRLDAAENLSAGEAQLLALARVFLADPGLVILDEASSRLDPATEQLIERALDKLLAGRTVIIIAHRLATVQRADEIMVLGNGRILEHDNRLNLATDLNSQFYNLLQTGLEQGTVIN